METASLRLPARGAVRGSKRLLSLRDDVHLVAQVRAGEPAAFEVLYERHVPGVLSFCRHMLGSREEAEDAVQQSFASAHRDLTSGDHAIKFKPWIYTIARHRCLSMLRARREELPEDTESVTAGLDAQVEARADLRQLVTDLQDLPEDQRAALLLAEIRDLSHSEVAEVLGCEAVQVKGLVHRARSGLLERREAREASCEDVRVELAAARGGGFRRGRLRHHLKACPACSLYLEDVRRQRTMMALVLPVVPSLGLKANVLGAIGLGGGASAGGLMAGGAAGAGAAGVAGGGGGAVASGGVLAAATVAKITAAVVIVGGTGAAGLSALDADGPSASKPPTSAVPEQPAGDGGAPEGSRPASTPARDGLAPGRRRTGRPGDATVRREAAGRRGDARAEGPGALRRRSEPPRNQRAGPPGLGGPKIKPGGGETTGKPARPSPRGLGRSGGQSPGPSKPEGQRRRGGGKSGDGANPTPPPAPPARAPKPVKAPKAPTRPKAPPKKTPSAK